jgi:hypothetical protein
MSMKDLLFWKRIKPAPGERTLEDEVRIACREWQLAEQIFREVQPEFVDSAILHWKSMEERYRVLLRRILSERASNEG